jgi:hypothetical protein
MIEEHLLPLKGILEDSSNYRYDEKGCKLWLGAQTNGYGQIWHPGVSKNYRVYRLAVALKENLSYHDSFYACHKCDTPPCYSTEFGHVYKGDRSTNSKDFYDRYLECPRGHEKNEENTRYERRDNGGKKAYCRICKYERHKQWRKDNPEVYKESQRRWRDGQL